MKKKILIFSFLLSLVSCGGSEGFKDINFTIKTSFDSGNVVYSTTYEEGFNVYGKAKGAASYSFETKVEGKEFLTTDIYKSYQFVPLKGNKEQLDYKIEDLNYYQGIFNNSNVRVFSNYDSMKNIQSYVNTKYSKLISEEFSSDRVAMLFMPGNYDDLTLNIGYYTTVNGLGKRPTNVSIKKLETKNNPNSKNALINFWRTGENISFVEDSTWAVSQATSLRRTKFNSNLSLWNYTQDGNNFSSGGFLADSVVEGTINSGTQQQWLTRNATFNEWSNSVMNMVFIGSEGNTPQGDWYNTRTSHVEKTPYIEEKPYIIFDESNGYGIIVPKAREDSVGVTWTSSTSYDETFVSLNDFYIANSESDNSITINKALSEGKHLLFTPGIYELDEPLKVTKDDTIIYGLGLATLTISDKNTDSCMIIQSEKGVKVSGLLFQAGDDSKCLLKVGQIKTENENSDNPICLYDLFFRVGGNTLEKTSVDVCVEINTNDVIADNFWVWRADHGITNTSGNSTGIGWSKNPGKNGIIVNGDDFLVYGLMVEHFLEYQTIWNGEGGRMYFYQSETPYDAPSQEMWMNKTGETPYDYGYASYKVNDEVEDHQAFGLGIYYVNTIKGVEKYCHHAVEIPDKEGVKFDYISARYFTGDGYIMNVVNNSEGVADEYQNRVLKSYCNGITT